MFLYSNDTLSGMCFVMLSHAMWECKVCSLGFSRILQPGENLHPTFHGGSADQCDQPKQLFLYL